MLFMNDYDIQFARQRFGRGYTPNRLALVITIDRLREWADSHSDGWAYWPKPVRAAAKAIDLVTSRTSFENQEAERHDITDEEMRAAARPIKAFCTRQVREGNMRASEREIILRSVES